MKGLRLFALIIFFLAILFGCATAQGDDKPWPTASFEVYGGPTGKMFFGTKTPRACVPGGTLVLQNEVAPQTYLVYINYKNAPSQNCFGGVLYHDMPTQKWRLVMYQHNGQYLLGLPSPQQAPNVAATHMEVALEIIKRRGIHTGTYEPVRFNLDNKTFEQLARVAVRP